MTSKHESVHDEGPRGSFFLPNSEQSLKNYQLALLLGRGPGTDKSPEELATLYTIAERELTNLRVRSAVEMGMRALTPEA